MSYGGQQEMVGSADARDPAIVNVLYTGHETILIRGAVTRWVYKFSRTRCVQSVDGRDAVTLLRTQHFGPGK